MAADNDISMRKLKHHLRLAMFYGFLPFLMVAAIAIVVGLYEDISIVWMGGVGLVFLIILWCVVDPLFRSAFHR